MNKQTKSIITRESIQNDLRFQNTAEIRGAVYSGFMLVFVYLPLIIFLIVISEMISVQLFLTVLLVLSPIILYAVYLYTVLSQRKKIADGEFMVVTAELSYKSETIINRRHVELLHFAGFRKCSVNHTIFQLADAGDEYYLVHFPDKTDIALLYPTEQYEYKSPPRS